MRIFRQFKSIGQEERPVHCAIGMFDGLHQGHQLLLRHIIEQAKVNHGMALALTFHDHPARILAPDHAPGLIYPQSLKEHLLEETGLDVAWIIPFDKALSELDATSFIRHIKNYCGNLKEICVGDNFAFGQGRKGNVTLLDQLGKDWGFHAECKPAVEYDGEAVSSTRIRTLITDGNFKKASDLLGRPYCLAGEVVKGDGLGRQLGFPTANVDCQSLTLPKSGVYAVQTHLKERRLNGVLNIGTRPTLNHPTPKLQVEVHFLDFDADIYGEFVSLEIKGRLRDEQRFPDVNALKHQIQKDIHQTQSMVFE